MSRVLVDVGQPHRGSEVERAGVGSVVPDDHAEERGLSGAVGADDADDASRRQREGHPVDQEPVAETLGDVHRLHDAVAQPGAGRDGELDPVGAPVGGIRLGFGHQGVIRVDARLPLALARPGGHPDPLELALEGGASARCRPCPRPRAAPASARATRSSCPPTGCRRHGRARGSSPRRCRGSSGRGSPRPPSPGTRATRARATRRTRRRDGWSARRAAAGRAARAAGGTGRRGVAHRRRERTRRCPPAADAARPSRSRRSARGPRPRPRRSSTGGPTARRAKRRCRHRAGRKPRRPR